MSEKIRFYFDPICPWCYQASRWLKDLQDHGHVQLSWGLFSLEIQNAGEEPEHLAEAHARSRLALATAVAVRDAAGSEAVGAFYGAVGRRVHEQGQPLEEQATITAALDHVGLDPELAEAAANDDSYAGRVAAEHRDLVERTASFGVPTIVLDDGAGPAIFGPVIAEPPSGHAAVELLEHTVWLARHPDFFELKRDRTTTPDLQSVRRRKQTD